MTGILAAELGCDTAELENLGLRKTGEDVPAPYDPAADIEITHQTLLQNTKPFSWPGFAARVPFVLDPAERLESYLRQHASKPDVSMAIPRTMMDKADFGTEDFPAMGFEPSYVAVPERGQSSLRTWRHPRSNIHVHEHPGAWMLHNDEHQSAQMAIRADELAAQATGKARSLGARLKSTLAAYKKGLPHITREGLPGWANYAGRLVTGGPTIAEKAKDPLLTNVPWKTEARIAALGSGLLGSYLLWRWLKNRKKKEDGEEKSAASATGIPDRAYYGHPDRIPAGTELDLVIKRHFARRAGLHFDVRVGDKRGLHSWVTRKGLPGPGGRVAMYHQPVHSWADRYFQGKIPSGYGAGTVKIHDEGKILVTKASPNFIHFTRTDKRYPERFVLFKPKTKPGRKDDWLLVNVTPTKPLPYAKVRYARVAAEDVEEKLRQMKEGDTVEAKIDGSASLVALLKDKVETVSYRAAAGSGFPIVHTERMFGGKAQLDVPKDLQGTVLKGEIFGTKNDKVIPPQELGGILNATVANSLQAQRDKKIKLKTLLYDIQQLGKKPIDLETTPRAERRELLERVMKILPKDKFQLSEAVPPEKALDLWRRIGAGQHPLTEEGIVGWPATGKPFKAKFTDDIDVHITGIFPGSGKYEGVGAGGFEYALEPGGQPVGKTGTGFSDEMRRDMFAHPENYIGRVARIRSQQQLPSGAYRAPSFIAPHEDYPAAVKTLGTEELTRSNRGEVDKQSDDSWRGVDLDGTLAHYEEFEGPTVIGKPVPKMVRRIKRWLSNGENVKILTARVSGENAAAARKAVERWCEKHIGQALPVTCKKDHNMTELWDDRAVQVVPNSGDRVDKNAEFDFSYEKQAADNSGFYWNALMNTQPQYNRNASIWQNIVNHLQRVLQFGNQRIRQHRNYLNFSDSLQGPDAKWRRIVHFYNTGQPPDDLTPADRMIERWTGNVL